MANDPGLLWRLKRHWFSAVLFLIPLAIYLAGLLWFKVQELYQHIMLTITAVMGIHVLDRLFLVKDTEEVLTSLVEDVRQDIANQTNSLLKNSKSLEAMNNCDIVQLYTSRSEAAKDIYDDVINAGNSKVRLLGISLNDFVREMDPNLKRAWTTIQAFVRGKKRIDDPSRGMDIRVLLIDPMCFGAVLRSEAESKTPPAHTKRLETDVQLAAKDLHALTQAARPQETGVHFECRLYRLPPTLFLCWVNSACYVQQYHFWSARNNRTPTPVLKFRSLPASDTTYPYHMEMDHHFDWIWNNASIPVVDYLEGMAVGTERGIYQCRTINVYTDPQKASDRIAYLLKRSQQKVSILGISLNSFFKTGALREAISGVIDKGTELEVLILDPESEQAKYRSYRERLFVAPNQSYDDYLNSGEHKNSDLFHDTNRTIQNIRHMISDLHDRKSMNWVPRLSLGLYKSAPACFVLRIDDRILIEQYHYGKSEEKNTRSILGKDMPLFEYCKSSSLICESDPLRSPFDLIENHLDFVSAQSKVVDLKL